jgi:hypothetical protein
MWSRRHAIRFTVPQTQRLSIWPARHYASSLTDPKYPPMGARCLGDGHTGDAERAEGPDAAVYRNRAEFDQPGGELVGQRSARRERRGGLYRRHRILYCAARCPQSDDGYCQGHECRESRGVGFDRCHDHGTCAGHCEREAGPASVRIRGARQFSATVSGSSNLAVSWKVNGMTGGNSTVGTISTGGLYTAPGSVPSPAKVTVTAVSAADPAASGSASVTVIRR